MSLQTQYATLQNYLSSSVSGQNYSPNLQSYLYNSQGKGSDKVKFIVQTVDGNGHP